MNSDLNYEEICNNLFILYDNILLHPYTYSIHIVNQCSSTIASISVVKFKDTGKQNIDTGYFNLKTRIILSIGFSYFSNEQNTTGTHSC